MEVLCRRLVHFLVFLAFCEAQVLPKVQLPNVEIQPLYPKGLKVSIPDDGFSVFSFSAKFNETMMDDEDVDWSFITESPSEGIWSGENSEVVLHLDDKIYYWCSVVKDGEIYVQIRNSVFTVTGFASTPSGGSAFGQSGPASGSSHFIGGPPYRGDSHFGSFPSYSPFRPSCDFSQTYVEGKIYICSGDLIFNEEFDKGSLADLKLWDPEVTFPEQPDYLFNVYQPNGTIEMKHGSLFVTPVVWDDIEQAMDLNLLCSTQTNSINCNDRTYGSHVVLPIISGKITTRDKFTFMYGRIEISAKLPSGDWLTPELTLEPRHNAYGAGHYESGLIRVAYLRGNAATSRRLLGGPVLADEEPFRSYYLREKVGVQEWNNRFHNYTLIWSPTGIETFVDGERYGTVNPGPFSLSGREYQVPHADRWNARYDAPLDESFYISLGVRVGGLHDFPDSPTKPWKNTGTKATLDFWKSRYDWLPTWQNSSLEVDYVRVYAL